MIDAEAETDALRLGERIKTLRRSKELTLSQIEDRCGVRASTISKIERGTISPSYATLLRLAKGLGVDLTDLIERHEEAGPKTRRAITRAGEGPVHSIGTHEYRFLCSDLTNKKMNPMIATVHAQDLMDLAAKGNRRNGLFSHDGEEVLYVISGEVVLHTEFYSPVALRAGDCAYIDSTMGHACIKCGEEDATILWVCTDIAIKPGS